MRVISLADNIIQTVKYVNDDYNLQENELQSEVGEIRQRMLEDDSFVDIEEYQGESLTIEEQILIENQYQTALLEMQLLGGI